MDTIFKKYDISQDDYNILEKQFKLFNKMNQSAKYRKNKTNPKDNFEKDIYNCSICNKEIKKINYSNHELTNSHLVNLLKSDNVK